MSRLTLLSVSILSIFLTSSYAFAFSMEPVPYYGNRFNTEILHNTNVGDGELVKELRKILSSGHIQKQGAADEIVDGCDTAQRGCVIHTAVGYKSARKIIMGQLYLKGEPGSYSIKDVYCEKDYTEADLGKGNIGPGMIPPNGRLNVEHTWPQSRFNSAMNRDMQKSDLHHLFPSETHMNSSRGNHPFGEVDQVTETLTCSTAKLGKISGKDGQFFEPPRAHRGNVARALFYFSVRYGLTIGDDQEAFLRKWNEQDPVDHEELERNGLIQKMQGDRNPFVDFPELAERIRNF